MSDELIYFFEKELINKISQKMVPNLSEEQCLIKFFKFYDLQNSGYCNLREWMKSLEKLGLVINRPEDLQYIFKYYDIEEKDYINYKEFAKRLFKKDYKSEKKELTYNNKKNELYFDKLHSILQNKGGRGLINFMKEFKIVDHNNTLKIDIDNFIKIITNNKINLNINEIQNLFHSYEFNNNGYFLYEEMFNDLKSIYINDKRIKFIDNFFHEFKTIINRTPKILDLKIVFDHRGHPKYLNKISSEDDLRYEFNEFADSFQFINKLTRNDSLLNKEIFIDFFNYYGYGIENDEIYIDLISSVFNIGKLKESRYIESGSKSEFNKEENKSKYQNDNFERTTLIEDNIVLEKLKKILKQLGRKSIFSLIKHFKYYDNGTKFINKSDFIKILRDFRLNMNIPEIEKIFELLNSDKKQPLINYEEFVQFVCPKLNTERRHIIKLIYDALSTINIVDIKLLRSLYNGRNNFYGLDENIAISEFVECLEIYNFSYKLKRNDTISFNEFEEFYRIISFLIDDDNKFSDIVLNEWKKINLENHEKRNIKKNEFEEFYSIPDKNTEIKLKENLLLKNNERPVSVKDSRPRTPDRSVSRDERSHHPSERNKLSSKSQLDKDYATQQNHYRRNEDIKKNDSLSILNDKLKKRGIRGLMNLHKQFLLSCSNLGTISYGDFIKVMKLQKIDLKKDDYDFIFDRFKQNSKNNSLSMTSFLNFPSFIRNFKRILPDKRLLYVEKVFSSLDIDQTEMLSIEDVKFKYESFRHPDVKKSKKSEDDVTTEFLDCFDLNYNFLANFDNDNENSNMISFQEFANFYEYVSFLYEKDEDFIELLVSTWNL